MSSSGWDKWGAWKEREMQSVEGEIEHPSACPCVPTCQEKCACYMVARNTPTQTAVRIRKCCFYYLVRTHSTVRETFKAF